MSSPLDKPVDICYHVSCARAIRNRSELLFAEWLGDEAPDNTFTLDFDSVELNFGYTEDVGTTDYNQRR